ncbi:hypothetical protein CMUS01_09095 [Colletotrichum musicola]|uniref:Uncharacterized protein n=1 Tax=Colletotrichum musicola TaxID=2175873 RepID=A0A8H6KA06_9PEZI|nr:hypothetical protein CMUS01_09095 [Colletotrichum musicola]
MAAPIIQLPSYDSVVERGSSIWPSVDFFRLRWYLRGPIEKSIVVIADAFDSTSPQEAYQTTTPDGGIRLHTVSQSCLTTIPVSSITVTVRALDDWEENWLDAHREVDEEDKEYVLLEDGTRRLVRVYGEERPGPSPTCVVQATTQPFVTVGDYVAAVHPWLNSLGGDIRRAKGVWRGAPLSSGCDIFLDPVQLDHLFTWDASSFKPSEEAKWRSVAKVARDRADCLAGAPAEAFGGEAS